MDDAAELAWWRHFASRFAPGDIPRVGEPVLRRMRVQVAVGLTWQPWQHRSLAERQDGLAALQAEREAEDAEARAADGGQALRDLLEDIGGG